MFWISNQFFFFICYTPQEQTSFSIFFSNILLNLLEKWAAQMTLFNIPLAVCKRILEIYTFMIVSLVFSVCVKICKRLHFHAENVFWQNKVLLENVKLGLSKGKIWILMRNYFLGTQLLRNAFVIRMVNS